MMNILSIVFALALLLGNKPVINAWNLPLNLTCSNPPLGVSYPNLRYYSGVVNCGNLLLESEIGGTHPWIPPRVTFDAQEGALYTLIYIDPFVNVPNNGTWPDCNQDCVGTKGPARHWLVGNIDANMLKNNGNISDATTVSKYKGPSPPWGSHPYGIFLFRQPGNKKIEFETLPSPIGIYNFDVTLWLNEYGFKDDGPVAMNWHVTMHADPRGENK